MKNILIMMYYMECGGVENAVIELMKNIDPKKFNIDLMLLDKRGDFIDRVPEYVNIKELNLTALEKVLIKSRSIREAIEYGRKNKSYFELIDILIKFIFAKLFKYQAAEYRAVSGKKKILDYDIAFDFHGYNSYTTYFISENVSAKQKFTWVHSESIIEKMKNYSDYIKKYDKIFCVSKKCVDDLCDNMPDISEKINLFKNFIDRDEIIEKSKEGAKINKKSQPSILTVGRLSVQKGYDIAIKTAKRLKDNNYDFIWYFCGEGEERISIEKEVDRLNLSNNVVMLGYQPNPYGYMKSCDIYVQSSRFEGYAVTLVEASILKKAIVTTDVSGAREEIIDGVNGYITCCDDEELYKKIAFLIDNEEIRHNMESYNKTENINADSLTILNSILNYS